MSFNLRIMDLGDNAGPTLAVPNSHASAGLFRGKPYNSMLGIKLNAGGAPGVDLDIHAFGAVIAVKSEDCVAVRSTVAAAAEEFGALCAKLVNQRKATCLDMIRGNRAG
jgi:hypothetical protein